MPEHPEKFQGPGDKVDGELYDELLGRYERILVYAGQLQEKTRQGRLLEERASSLQRENERLKKEVGVDEAYIRLLERALESLGVLSPRKAEEPDAEVEGR